jgi:hypothetical protein
MAYKTTERSLYRPIANVLSKYGIECVEEVSIQVAGAPRPQYPDLVAKINDYKFIIEVKVDGARKLLEVAPQAFIKAQSIGAQGCISILFPSYVRQIDPNLLNSVAPQLKIIGAIISLPWITGYKENLSLEELARIISDYYKLYLESKRPTVSYDSIVKVAREAVVEVARSIRQNLITQYINDAMMLIGRFDLYRATLEDFNISEAEMKAWIADIAAYLTVSQILFYYILSQKRPDKYPPLPDVNPLVPDIKLLETLRKLFANAAKEYEPIFGPDLLSMVERSGGVNSIVAISKYIMALKALKPEHVKEELLGRLYQESIPPEARKNLGAFFTKPKAATILATLAIDRWDEVVLDPACGSGTLLTEAYLRRKELAEAYLKKATPGLSEDKLQKILDALHIKLLEKTYGIDIMHFAYHMTSINLLIQNIKVPAKLEHIRAGDGLEPMINTKDPPQVQLTEWLGKVTPEQLPCEFFDCVIMNPPFTRRERLVEIGEIDRLNEFIINKLGVKLNEIIRGKVGYWAYFLAAADNVLKVNGKLACVTPEEFFAGSSAESLRRYLFRGEIYDPKKGEYIKKLARQYIPLYIVRSGVEVAFSERALYRDYLMVLLKTLNRTFVPLTLIILKKELDKIDYIKDVAIKIKEFAYSDSDKIQSDLFDGIKIKNIEVFLEKHIFNLKPLVGFNTIKAQELALKLLDELVKYPTLGELERKNIIRMRYYNPGQYPSSSRGSEREARLLFATRYGAKGKCIFRVLGEQGNYIIFREEVGGRTFKVPREALLKTLRTYSGVKHMDITGEEEYAIVDPAYIPENIKRDFGLVDEKVKKAARGIREAYKDLAGDILLVRKLQIPSPGIYWLAFRSKDKVLGTTDRINVRVLGEIEPELLCLYLNSSIVLLQLLAFHVETRGAWIRLDKEGVWSEIHVPDLQNLEEDVRKSARELYKRLSKADLDPIYDRIKNRSPEQIEIDRIALRMLGLKNWDINLNELYSSLLEELDYMLRILNSSKESKRKLREKISELEEDDEAPEVQKTIDNYLYL